MIQGCDEGCWRESGYNKVEIDGRLMSDVIGS